MITMTHANDEQISIMKHVAVENYALKQLENYRDQCCAKMEWLFCPNPNDARPSADTVN